MSLQTQLSYYRIATCESRRPGGTHVTTYNAPTVNEVAVLLPNDPVGQPDIILHTRSNQLQGIYVLHIANDKYVQQLKSAYEFAKDQFPSYKIVINENVSPTGGRKGRYSAPTTYHVPNDPVDY